MKKDLAEVATTSETNKPGIDKSDRHVDKHFDETPARTPEREVRSGECGDNQIQSKNGGLEMSDIEQIKAAIDLRSLIGETCKLDSSGRGAHENKHDSESGNCLYVDGDWWHCHHCKGGGDALNWIMDRDGTDFPEALRTAAEITGIPLDGTDPEAESERRAVFEVLKAAATHFNNNLTLEHRAAITEQWGIMDRTINDLLIGIARTDDALEVYLIGQGFTHDQIVKSGLFLDWGSKLLSHFQGRFVFPYRKNGTVRYMIARQTKHTPKGKSKAAKYKKLLTHNDKCQYVSEHVRNDTIFGVDSLRGAADWCLITEGVTDCIMAIQAGLPCISPVTVTFRKADHNRILRLVKRFKTVYVCNDAEDNEAGLKGAIGTAEFLEANGTAVKIVILPRPDGVEKIDLAEYLRDYRADEFRTLFDTAVSVWNVKLSRQPVTDAAVENVKTAKTFIVDDLSGMDAAERVAFVESDVKAHFGLSDDTVKELVKVTPTAPEVANKAPMTDMSSTDRLIELGKQDAVFFHLPDDTCYAAVKLESGGSAIYPVDEKSRQFKKILKHRYYKETGKAPANEPLKAAIGVLESIAAFEGDTIELHNRVAWRGGNICYDLTSANYEAIEITPRGWGLMPHGHILFRRFGHQIPQAQPVSGGDVWRLYEFVSVPESDQLLDMVRLISCLVPGIPHPISITTGEHGSTKTTGSKMKKSLIDPSDLDVMALQPNEERMAQMLFHHWFLIFDNVTYLQQWQSDMICRGCTGEGTVRRTLYSNEDDTIFKYKCCIDLNGINNAATKPDLLDRAFFLNHEPIPMEQRIEEKVLFERFNEAKPAILGGMFDALSGALRIYPTIDLKEKPRMADFAVWGCAIAEALGRTEDEFLESYYDNIGRINRTALEESPVGLAMLAFMEGRAEWDGTPSILLRELDLIAEGLYIDTKSKAWVKRPESLGKRLKLVAPNLRAEGIAVEIRRVAAGQEYRITNRSLYATTKPTQPTQPTLNRHSIAKDADSVNLHEPTQPTLKPTQISGSVGSQPTLNAKPTLNLHTKNQQRTAVDVGCVGNVGFVTACRTESTSELGVTPDDKFLILVGSAIYQITSSDRPTFDPAQVLMKLKGRTDDATIERIIDCLGTYAAELQIEPLPSGRYRKAVA